MGYVRDSLLDLGAGAPRTDGRPDRVLSSPYTFVEKFLYPPVVVLGAGFILIVGMFNLGRGKMTNVDRGGMAFCAGWFLWQCWRQSLPLKRVILTKDGLLVSNYRSEILVLFGSLRAIEQPGWQRVRVSLNEETPYGRDFMFTPVGGLPLWGEAPIVTELRGLAKTASKA